MKQFHNKQWKFAFIMILLILFIKADLSKSEAILQSKLETIQQNKPETILQNKGVTYANYVPFPRILWAYWSSEKQMGDLERHFYVRIQQFMKKGVNTVWKFILLTDKNLKEYIKQYQKCMQIINSVKVITPANKADIVRLFLLQQHGGLYFDITSAFVEDLSWLQLQNLIANPLVVNKHIIHSPQPDVLMFYGTFHQYRNEYNDEFNTRRNDFPGYETWFIASKSKANFITDWKMKLIEYYSASADYIFEDMRKYDIFFSNFYYETYHNVYLALYFVMQQKQKQLDSETTFINRNYVNLYYKVWAINCDCGPCMVYGEQIRQESYPKYFFNKPKSQLAHVFSQKKVNYFIKFTHYHLNGFRDVLQKMTQKQIQNQSLIQYYQSEVNKYHAQKPWLQNCANFTLYLGSQSFVYKYVFQGFQATNSSTIKAFTSKQISNFNKYCQQISLNENNEQIIDKIASMNLKQYLQNIVFVGFLLAICLVLLYYVICRRTYLSSRLNLRSKWKQQQHYINKQENYDLLKILAAKFDWLFKQIVGIQIHYYFINVIMTAFLIYKFFIGEVLNVREQHISVFFTFTVTKFIQKFIEIHASNSYVPHNFKIFLHHLQNICLAKLIAQLIFNEPNYFYFSTIFISIFGCTIIQNIEKDKQIFKSINEYVSLCHEYSLIILLMMFAFVPNLKYFTLQGEYLTFRVYQLYLIYIWLLAITVVLLQIQSFIQKYGEKQANPFHSTKRIFFAYWLTTAFAVFYDSYSNYIYIAELMMSRRVLLLGAVCLYASTRHEYSRSVRKSRVFSIFSIILGGSLMILAFLFNQIYHLTIKIQEDQEKFILLFDILSLVYLALAVIKVTIMICEQKYFIHTQPNTLEQLTLNEQTKIIINHQLN